MIEKIISGGQTGADRAALDFAIAHAIPHGGWCLNGRLAEDGLIDAGYHLKETPSANYVQRTEWNSRDSDGTVVFSIAPALTGEVQEDRGLFPEHGKPCLHLSRQADGAETPERLRQFIREHRITVLNVAGPRATNEPEVAAFGTGAY